MSITSRESEFFDFIHQRQLRFSEKFSNREVLGKTDNKIFDTVKFTNVYRELDRGTLYVIENIVNKCSDLRDLLLNLIIFRLFNKEETFTALGLQKFDDWSNNFQKVENHFLKTLSEIENKREHSVFTNAFMVNSFRHYKGSYTPDSKATRVLAIVRDARPIILQFWYDRDKRLSDLHKLLTQVYGVGDFLAYEILVDYLYSPLSYSQFALHHENAFVNVGPGAHAGLSYIYGQEDCANFVQRIYDLQKISTECLLERGFHFLATEKCDLYGLTLRNIEHSLCEFYKFIKIKQQNSRPKNYYRKSTQPINYSVLHSIIERNSFLFRSENFSKTAERLYLAKN